MDNLRKKLSKKVIFISIIFLLILSCMVGIAYGVTVGYGNGTVTFSTDSDIASQAANRTDTYFGFNALNLLGETINKRTNDRLLPYHRVGEYCIDTYHSQKNSKKFKVVSIIDLTPDGDVRLYKNKTEYTYNNDNNPELVRLLKQMAYVADKSIAVPEGNVGTNSIYTLNGNTWKVTMQYLVHQNAGSTLNLIDVLGTAEMKSTIKNKVNQAKVTESATESVNRSYTARFVFLYGDRGQNQIIFSAKEGDSLGNISIKKLGAGVKELDNVGFVVQKDDGTYIRTGAEGIEYVTDKSVATEFYTDANGNLTIEKVKAGTYTFFETTNPHYGYEADPNTGIADIKVTPGESGEPQIIHNKQVYIKLSGYVWVDKIFGKTSLPNDLYNDGAYDSNDILLDGIKVRLVDKDTGNTLKEAVTANGGAYQFVDVLVADLAKYRIEFEYDGLTYTNVVPHIDVDNGSKAIENDEERTTFNNGFYTVEGELRDTGYTTDNNGMRKHKLNYNISESEHKATLINNGKYTITSNTDEAKYNIAAHYVQGEEEIRYINLGLKEREQTDLALTKDLESVKLAINNYQHVYKYAQRPSSSQEYGDGFNVGVKFQSEYSQVEYRRAIYEADYNFETDQFNKDRELKVYATYKISIKNQATNLISKVNSIVEYHDSNYQIIAAGTGYEETKGEIAGKSLDVVSTEENSTDNYNKSIINTRDLSRIGGQSEGYIYVQFALNRTAVLTILNDGTSLNNIAEINSYTTYDQDGIIYASIDVDSNPGNCTPGNSGTYEDDTDVAPTLKLEVADARVMNGMVFLDYTTGELMTNRERRGTGELEVDEEGNLLEKGINGVTVVLTEIVEDGDERKPQRYTAGPTGDDGYFEITGFIPGDYEVTYIWGEKTTCKIDEENEITISVQDYKGTIYDKNRFGENSKDKSWHEKENTEIRFTDALDDYVTRGEIDDELKTINNTTGTDIKEMASTTPTMGIGVEYKTTFTASEKDLYTYEIKNIDFGIVERPRQELGLSKRISSMKVTLANGQVIVDLAIDENGNVTGEKSGIVYMGPSNSVTPKNGLLKLELDNELIQGAIVEVQYVIEATNRSELDYLSENYYKHGIPEGDPIKITPTKIIDYLDNSWAFESENNSAWNIIEDIEDIKDLVSDKVEESETLNDRLILYTESLGSESIGPGESRQVNLLVSKMLSTSDEIELDNEVEVLEFTKDGGSKPKESTPGNYVPGTDVNEVDDDKAETVTVTPSTGGNYIAYILPVVIGVVALVVLGVGIFVIKRKTLDSGKKE